MFLCILLPSSSFLFLLPLLWALPKAALKIHRTSLQYLFSQAGSTPGLVMAVAPVPDIFPGTQKRLNRHQVNEGSPGSKVSSVLQIFPEHRHAQGLRQSLWVPIKASVNLQEI